jgi:hypothetical protein
MSYKRKAENPYEKVYLKSRRQAEKPPEPAPPPTPTQPAIPKLKLIIRRKSGDNYEVDSSKTETFFPNKSSTFAQLSRLLDKTKAEIKPELSVNVNRTKSSENRQLISQIISPVPQKKPEFEPEWEIVSKFSPADIAINNSELKKEIKQPKVMLRHSIPFPVALVEDKTNVVFTKALLFLHLFQSYSSPCIMCVLCKQFHSVGTFSKHLHIEDIESSSGSESETESVDSQLALKRKKLELLKKRTFKILPYFIGANYSTRNLKLSEQQIKSWKMFTEKFLLYKQQKRNEAHEAELFSLFNDWDYSNPKENVYVLSRNKIDNEKIVYIELKSEPKKVPEPKHKVNKKESVLSDSDSESSNEAINGYFETKQERRIYIMHNLSLRAKIFNYYDNLSRSILTYMKFNEYTIVPQSLIDYNLKCRENSARSPIRLTHAKFRSFSRLLLSF